MVARVWAVPFHGLRDRVSCGSVARIFAQLSDLDPPLFPAVPDHTLDLVRRPKREQTGQIIGSAVSPCLAVVAVAVIALIFEHPKVDIVDEHRLIHAKLLGNLHIELILHPIAQRAQATKAAPCVSRRCSAEAPVMVMLSMLPAVPSSSTNAPAAATPHSLRNVVFLMILTSFPASNLDTPRPAQAVFPILRKFLLTMFFLSARMDVDKRKVYRPPPDCAPTRSGAFSCPQKPSASTDSTIARSSAMIS